MQKLIYTQIRKKSFSLTEHAIYEKHNLAVHMMYKSGAQTNQLFWHKHFVFNWLLFAVPVFDGLFWFQLIWFSVFVNLWLKEVYSLALKKYLVWNYIW